jgi:hypothetical protein
MAAMRPSRVLAQQVCRLMIGLFLFGQLAVAAYACEQLNRLLPAGMTEVSSDASMPDGCESMDPNAPTLCFEHCEYGAQGVNTSPAPSVAAAGPSVLYIVASIDRALVSFPGYVREHLIHLGGAPPPPHAILHCCRRD